MNKNYQEFFTAACNHLATEGVHVYLEASTTVQDGCSGVYLPGDYGPEGGELYVATGDPHWDEAFAHEYCHFLQDLDGSTLDYVPLSTGEVASMWRHTVCPTDTWRERWARFRYPLKQATYVKYLRGTRAMEVDCDRRVLERLGKADHGIDLERYAQCANAYHMFYTVMETTHRWCDMSPCDVDEIVDRMPTRLLTDHYVDAGLMALFVDNCYDE